MENQITGKAIGAKARSEKLSPAERSEIARIAANSRWSGPLAIATHGSDDHPLKIGDMEIPCFVLEDGRRVLIQKGMINALGMSKGERWDRWGPTC